MRTNLKLSMAARRKQLKRAMEDNRSERLQRPVLRLVVSNDMPRPSVSRERGKLTALTRVVSQIG